MKNAGHLVVAGIAGAATVLAWNAIGQLRALGPVFGVIPLDFTLACVIGLGAMLPDVDHNQTRIFKFALATVFTAVAWLSLPLVGGNYLSAVGAGAIAALLAYLLKPKHRGVTHSWQAALVYGVACALLTRNAGLALTGVIAYASHLVADA